MNEFKGTPGPWSFDGEYVWADAISGYVADPSTEDMTSGECVPRNKAHTQIVANGRLIAAAPELLECLQKMTDMWNSICDVNGWDPEHNVQYGEARAAIAKATGA